MCEGNNWGFTYSRSVILNEQLTGCLGMFITHETESICNVYISHNVRQCSFERQRHPTRQLSNTFISYARLNVLDRQHDTPALQKASLCTVSGLSEGALSPLQAMQLALFGCTSDSEILSGDSSANPIPLFRKNCSLFATPSSHDAFADQFFFSTDYRASTRA